MASVLDAVDLRTQLVGENRLELLMFRLHGDQLFAINVFKVQEVQQMPALTLIPYQHPIVVGVTHVRGATIPVIDLSKAINMAPMDDYTKCNIIITEYNMSVQAFMVRSVDRIINLTWDKISAPPKGAGNHHFLTAITQLDSKLVEVIDVEKVLVQIKSYCTEVSAELIDPELTELGRGKRILAVDDSTVGLAQVKSTLEYLGLEVVTLRDGMQAHRHLLELAEKGISAAEHYLMMITDAEMPEMDGYRLTHECRQHPMLRDLFIVMHTSLSGNFNVQMVKKVGCDGFISKFQPDQLAELVQNRLRDLQHKADLKAVG